MPPRIGAIRVARGRGAIAIDLQNSQTNPQSADERDVAKQLLGRKGIEDLYPRVLEIRDIPRHQRQVVAMSGGGELAIK